MIFGSISYLNLLPFQVFLKRYLKHPSARMAFAYKRNVPSQINHALRQRHVHAGFISSIESERYHCTNLGIIANQAVYSVFLIPGESQPDDASATSNQLAQVLNLKGEVIIGDRALQYYLQGGEGIDLAKAWFEKTSLPFVFARLCFNCHQQAIQRIAQKFQQRRIKIPQYILKKEANKRAITPQQLLWYLEHIEYVMHHKAEKSLRKFLKESRNTPNAKVRGRRKAKQNA